MNGRWDKAKNNRAILKEGSSGSDPKPKKIVYAIFEMLPAGEIKPIPAPLI